MYVVGGLGGGGDGGGSLVIGIHLMELGIRPIVVSFHACRASSIFNANSITGALVHVTKHSSAS